MNARIIIILNILFFIHTTSVYAHEPIFGIGPHTIFKGGIGLEMETEITSQSTLLKDGNEVSDPENKKAFVIATPVEIIYGITSNFSITAKIPYLIKQSEKTINGKLIKNKSDGLGDMILRGKYRFFKHDSLGIQDQAALVLGVKAPTSNGNAEIPLGTGSFDFMVGLTGAHEARRFYSFADVMYRMNTEHNSIRHGNNLNYDMAVGIRPYLSSYKQPDLVLLVELNGEYEWKNKTGGGADDNSGGSALFYSPGFLISYRNAMLKGGIKFPIFQSLNGIQLADDYEAVLALEFHF